MHNGGGAGKKLMGNRTESLGQAFLKACRSRAAPSSRSAERETLQAAIPRAGGESKKQSGGLFLERGRPGKEGVPLFSSSTD